MSSTVSGVDRPMSAVRPASAAGEVERLFDDVLKAISLALDFDEGVKLHHASRVAVLAHRIAARLELPERDRIYYAGFLHDIGSIGLRHHVVHHARAGFSDPEAKGHATLGARIIRPFSLLRPMEGAIANHHERIDGGGFPNGRSGGEIPLGASILYFADLVDVVLGVHPPERRGRELLSLAKRERGTGCPAAVADAAVEMFAEEPELLEALFSESGLEELVQGTRPFLPDVARLTRSQLLGQILWVFARIVDAKHSYTMGHSTRMAFFAHRIAGNLGEGTIDLSDVLWAALLHDVGKVGVPRQLLDKSGALTDEELEIVRRHAGDSQAIIGSITDLRYLAYPAAAHHEWYDGNGYPEGRAGEEIPLVGRILAFADVYDALTSDRAYRRALDHDDALGLMEKMVGSQLDPHLAETAFETLNRYGAVAREAGGELHAFLDFFHSEDADISIILDPALGADSRSRTRGVGKGVLLVELEPWRSVRLDSTLSIIDGQQALAEATGETSKVFADNFDGAGCSELLARLRERDAEPATQYVFTRRGKPLEIVVFREGDHFRVLYRSAENRIQTIKRMSLFYRNFLSSTEAVVFTNPEMSIIDVNRTLLDLTGYQLREIVGRNIDLLRGESTTPELYGEIAESLRDSGVGAWSGELAIRRKNGPDVPALLMANTVRDSAGTTAGYILRAVDITERKEAEEALRRRDQELSEKNAALERLNRLKSDLVAVTSHDLRSPLGSIVSLARLARERIADSDPLAGYLDRITESGLRLTHFVSDILDVESIEAGGFRLSPRRIRVDAVLASAIAALPGPETTGVAVALASGGIARRTLADPARIEQVFANLLSNAIKFSPRGSSVEAGIVDDGGSTLRITVSDRGPGIPNADLEAIFDRYYQVERKGAVAKRGFGVGLGLAIVENLVRAHGGEVRAENRDGGGCRFVVELPIREPEGADALPLALLVDPEGEIARQIDVLLERARLRWVAVRDPIEARRILAFEEPELLFVDRVAISEGFVDECALRRFPDGSSPFVVEVWPEDAVPSEGKGGGTLTLPALDVELLELVRAAADARRRRDR